MSVFINDSADEEVPLNRKIRKKYYTKYNVKYQEEYPWALPSSKGELHSFCQLCHVDICIKSVGAKGLRDHEATCRHSQKAHQMGLRSTFPPLAAPASRPNPQRFKQSQNFVKNESSVLHINTSRNDVILSSTPNEVPSYVRETYSTPQSFSLTSVSIRGQQIQLQTSNHSLIPSKESNLTSSMYPVLEITDTEIGCLPQTGVAPQSPKTPNTPSSPFNQEHFTPVNNKSNREVDCQMPALNCQMTNSNMASCSSYDISKVNCEGSVMTPQFQDPNITLQRDSKDIKEYILSLRDLSLRESDEGFVMSSVNMHSDVDRKPVEVTGVDTYSEILNTALNAVEDTQQADDVSQAKSSDEDATDQNNASSNWTLDDDPKSSTLSVGDLTCNICGEVFLDWKELKKDLLEHVKEAQKASIAPTQQNQSASGLPKKEKRLTTKEKKPSVGVNASVNAIKSPEKKKRGRPPRTKIKTVVSEDSNISVALCEGLSNASDSSMLDSSSVVPHAKRKRGRPLKSKAPTKEVLSIDCGSLICPPGDEEYWVENVDLASHATDAILDSYAGKVGSNQQPAPIIHATSRRSGQLQCRVCKGMFYLKQELRDHYVNEHNNGRPYECTLCHKFFSTRNHLQVHNKFKHDEGPNPCLCAVCGKTLSSRTNLKIHMMIHKGERPFSCPICSQQFSRKANMEMHIVYHTGERKFTCEVCGQSFFAINALKRHNKLHTGERDYECDVCGASYVTGTDLRRHRLKHADVKPFPCSICDKQFTRAHDLKVHLRYHNRELRFTCSICGKQFVESGNFRRHMRRHTGERPYSCKFCQQSFSQVHHYKVHMRTSHAKQDGSTGEVSSSGQSSTQRNGRSQKGSQIKKVMKIATVTSNNNAVVSQQNGNLVSSPGGLTSNSMPNNLLGIHHQMHNVSSQSQTAHPCMVSQVPQVCSIPPAHVSNTTVASPVAHVNNVGISMIAPHASQVPSHAGSGHPAGFLQYNSYIYNTGVIPQYPTLFDGSMCAQLPSGSHIGPP